MMGVIVPFADQAKAVIQNAILVTKS